MREISQTFLNEGPWSGSIITPIAGDLSARSYVRVHKNGSSAVLMDAKGDAASTTAFVEIADWLRGLDLSAPEVFQADPEGGLLVLEDLGDTPVSQVVSDQIIEECIRLLGVIRKASPPALSAPTAAELADWTRIVDAYYPNADTVTLEAFRACLETVLTNLQTDRPSVSLRDFHLDNLMWLPDRKGVACLGLLDFQDAFLCHPVYDLVSLLTDARTEISPETRAFGIETYLSASDDDPDAWRIAFAAFSVQRNLRILGVFLRAAAVDGKTHHLPKIPRVRRYLAEALVHPVFAEMRDDVLGALPPLELAS